MLEETDRIDLISRTEDGKVILGITDAGITTDPQQRFNLLVANVRTCIAYILGDEFERDHPGQSASDAGICVLCANPPTEQMKKLSTVRPTSRPDLVIPVQFEQVPFNW